MCPRCQRASLMGLGEFWICDVCGLVILDQETARRQPPPSAVPGAPKDSAAAA